MIYSCITEILPPKQSPNPTLKRNPYQRGLVVSELNIADLVHVNEVSLNLK